MNYYDETAKGYSELHGAEQKRKAEIILKYLKENKLINETLLLLDVGCGSCISTSMFPGDKTGIDPSKKLLQQCKDPSIKLVHGKAEDLPFPDDWFDVVISLTAVHNFGDFEKGLREMLRVGKHLFVITLLKKSPKYQAIEATIRKLFKVETVLDDSTDTIFVLKDGADIQPAASRDGDVQRQD